MDAEAGKKTKPVNRMIPDVVAAWQVDAKKHDTKNVVSQLRVFITVPLINPVRPVVHVSDVSTWPERHMVR